MKTRRKMMWTIACLIAIVLVTGLVGACSEPAPSPSPTPAPTSAPTPAPTPAPTSGPKPTAAPSPTPAPEPEMEPMELIYCHSVPPMADLYGHGVAFADKITELSGGKITFVHYAAGALVPFNEYYPAIQRGAMDVMHIGTGDYDFHPSSWFTRLPFLGLKDMRMGTDIVNDLYNEFPEIREEYAEFGMFFSIRAMPPDALHTVSASVKVPADMKGLKIHGGEAIAPVIAAGGAAPVNISLPDWYTSLETGIIDGIWDHFAVIDAFGVTPVFQEHTVFGPEGGSVDAGGSSMGTCGITWNWDTWNKLPPNIQDGIMDLHDWYVDGALKMDIGALEKAWANARAVDGYHVSYCTDEDVELWKPLGQSLYDEYLEKMAKEGKPGQEILAEAQRLIAEY